MLYVCFENSSRLLFPEKKGLKISAARAPGTFIVLLFANRISILTAGLGKRCHINAKIEFFACELGTYTGPDILVLSRSRSYFTDCYLSCTFLKARKEQLAVCHEHRVYTPWRVIRVIQSLEKPKCKNGKGRNVLRITQESSRSSLPLIDRVFYWQILYGAIANTPLPQNDSKWRDYKGKLIIANSNFGFSHFSWLKIDLSIIEKPKISQLRHPSELMKINHWASFSP